MRKQYILYIVVIAILFSLIAINNGSNVSALNYSSSVGVGFTFNPTLSVSISPSNLAISNLVPDSTLDSNVINVSVASNASYGYTLSTIVNGNNSNLTHSNGTNIFSSIATNADLPSLDNSEDTNIWGYSYKDNAVVSPYWSNYNGLSNSDNTTLINTNSNASSNLDFKIAAKASNTQASGTYAGVINFTAVSNVAPMSLLDSFIASGAEQLNGYFKMQDMTHDICESVDIEESELQLIDVRDNKVYWVAKLKDGNCWMTQNLDLDLSSSIALTSETSDIDPDSYGKTIYTAETGYDKNNETNVVSWLPSTIDSDGTQRADTIDMAWSSNTNATISGWANDNNKPYSANAGNRYRYTDSSGNETVYTSFEACYTATNNASSCQHAHLGNYYNWSATVASNNTIDASSNQINSICPKNWDLPAKGEYDTMLQSQGIWTSGTNYATNGFLKIRTLPLYFVRSGYAYTGSLSLFGNSGYYWSSTIRFTNISAWNFHFGNDNIWPSDSYPMGYSFSVRCIAK